MILLSYELLQFYNIVYLQRKILKSYLYDLPNQLHKWDGKSLLLKSKVLQEQEMCHQTCLNVLCQLVKTKGYFGFCRILHFNRTELSGLSSNTRGIFITLRDEKRQYPEMLTSNVIIFLWKIQRLKYKQCFSFFCHLESFLPLKVFYLPYEANETTEDSLRIQETKTSKDSLHVFRNVTTLENFPHLLKFTYSLWSYRTQEL